MSRLFTTSAVRLIFEWVKFNIRNSILKTHTESGAPMLPFYEVRRRVMLGSEICFLIPARLYEKEAFDTVRFIGWLNPHLLEAIE
jgi:hypothetical protein